MSDGVARDPRLGVSEEEIGSFCRRWRIVELSLFGSALREDFRSDSDVDLLVSFAPGMAWKLDDLLDMKEELEKLFARRVDLVERRLVERSENYVRRRHILGRSKRLYVA
jgi:uncharacterized protein